jgi:hypothetical protein
MKPYELPQMGAAPRRLLLMSFEGIGKSIRMIRAPNLLSGGPAHHSDEFPAGYSSAGCSPAAPASASPADATKYAAELAQLRARFKRNMMNGIALKLWLV